MEKEKIDVEKKAVIVTDKFRTVEKMLMAENLQDFLNQGMQAPRLIIKTCRISCYYNNLL